MKALLLCIALLSTLAFAEVRDSSSGHKHAVFLNESYHTGFISNKNQGELFYILLDSRNAPETDPLVLWLTGGPGCSSELAIFTENGPFRINNETLELTLNPYSWNNNANLLYVDQPAGTGFSSTKVFDTNETDVARDFYNFLLGFLNKHPQFKGRDFYITGESFAGHYIPAITSHILAENNSDINIQGIAIGNGWVDPVSQYPQYPYYAYQNGLINETLFNELNQQFELCTESLMEMDWEQASLYCGLAYMQIVGNPTRFNIYDYHLPCNGPLCYDFSFVDRFLALPEVIKALGVEGRQWSECNAEVHQYFQYDHEYGYASDVANVLSQNVPVLVYNGDLDYVCNYMGGHAWTSNMDYNGHEEFMAQNFTDFGTFGQYKTAQGLTFLRVYNAGHLVPMDQPEAAINLLSALINKEF